MIIVVLFLYCLFQEHENNIQINEKREKSQQNANSPFFFKKNYLCCLLVKLDFPSSIINGSQFFFTGNCGSSSGLTKSTWLTYCSWYPPQADPKNYLGHQSWSSRLVLWVSLFSLSFSSKWKKKSLADGTLWGTKPYFFITTCMYLPIRRLLYKRDNTCLDRKLKLVWVSARGYMLRHGWISTLIDMNSVFGDAKN